MPPVSAALSACLDRLMPHVQADRVAIAGGVALHLGLAERGRQSPRDRVADLDLVAAPMTAIASTVAGSFLVSHYHAVGRGVPKAMIQLVEPASRIRVDIFPDLAGALADARTLVVGGHPVRVLPLERIFEHKLQTLARARASAPVDPKHHDDVRLLGEVLGRPVPDVPDVSPGALVREVYASDLGLRCERCERSSRPDWPLAPKDRIFELLGYV